MHRKQISQIAPSVQKTAKNQQIVPTPIYGSLSSVVQRVQLDPKSVTEDERQQLQSAIGTRSTREILSGKQTPWIPEFQGISQQLWGHTGQPIQTKGRDNASSIIQRMRVTSAVLAGQYVGEDQNRPGTDGTGEWVGEGRTYHYHANNYQSDREELRSITLTIRSTISGRVQHVTANEYRRGDWDYRIHGDQIISWGTVQDRLESKIRLLQEAQQRADNRPRESYLDMSLGDVIRRNAGTY